MKKIILPLFFMALISLFTTNLKAGTVSIDTTTEGRILPCDTSRNVFFFAGGSTTGYNAGDTIVLKILYGDGDSSFHFTMLNTNGNFFWQTSHSYPSIGQYTVAYIATAPDMAADTVIKPNSVIFADSCGNISGQVYADANNNCVLDGSETPLNGVRVSAYLGSQYINSDWTDTSGYYYINVPSGQTYTITTSATYGYNNICPASGVDTITNIPSSGNDFAIDCGIGFDLFPNAHGWSVPGQNLNLYLNVHNSFCQSQSGTVKLIFNDSLYSYGGISSTTPASINGDTLEWNFAAVSNGWQNGFSVNVGAYTDTTAQIGDTVCVTVIVDPIAGDNNANNNIKTFCIPVRTSYDPNIKVAQPIGVGDSGRIHPNTEMTYTVHFQNTGTAPAFNVYILDTLDTSVLDQATIEVQGASHAMNVNLLSPNQNILKFRFDDIMLADSTTNEPESHGWVTYTIKQQSNLPNGTTIQNSASIYFDYNPPVVTESTLNTIDDQLVSIKEIVEQVHQQTKIYPNPATDLLTVEFSANAIPAELRIMDINGKLIRQHRMLNATNQFDVSAFDSGIYLLEMRQKNGQREVIKMVISK